MAREEDESVASLMRSMGIEPEPEEPSGREIDETVNRVLRGLGWDAPSPPIAPALAQAGPKLKGFRERSGWTAAEIAERTGVLLQVLEAFEAGEPVVEDELLPVLERVASACCCSIEELGLERFELHKPLRRAGRSRPRPLW
jgi:hypothetical protein